MAKIYKSDIPDQTFPELSLTQYVLQTAGDCGDSAALIDGPSGRTIKYSALKTSIQLVAGGLRKAGLATGEVVAIISPNLPEYALAFHGTAWVGGTVTTMNPTYTSSEMHHQLEDSGAKFVITIGMFLETVTTAAKDTKVEKIYTFDGADGSEPFASLCAGEKVEEQVKVELSKHIVALPYSSGTTGRSKGVKLSHRNLVANLVQVRASGIQFAPTDSFVAVLPFFHIYGLIVLMNMGLSGGSTLITVPRFDLVQFLELNQKHKCTWAFVVPPIVLAFAKHPVIDKYDLSSLKCMFSGAAPLSADTAEKCSKRLGASVVQGYGMTELSPVSHLSTPDTNKPGSCGKSIANIECRIVDEDGKDVAVGERGELWIRGPNVMLGYLNNEEATKHTIDADGFLHTGDVATIDDGGNYYIVDRLKELIKVKGFQVMPAELIAILLEHDDITDAAVVGVKDEEAGELPKAYVVKRDGCDLSEDDVKEFVKGKVATFKQIKFVEFIDAIPKSASGKLLLRVLRERANQK